MVKPHCSNFRMITANFSGVRIFTICWKAIDVIVGSISISFCRYFIVNNWAAKWQNQQNECAPSKDSDQPGHLHSLIRVFAVRMKKPWVLSYPLSTQQRLWSDWADAQADWSLRWAHNHFVDFVMSWLNLQYDNYLIERHFTLRDKKRSI